jgi:hypothetical protein
MSKPPVAELYLVCLGCARIPDWTNVTVTIQSQGKIVKGYEFTGNCPYCGGGKFNVVEVTNKQESRPS